MRENKKPNKPQREQRSNCGGGNAAVLWYNVAMKSFAIEIIPDEEMGGFTARIPGIPAYGEGETEDAAIADLKEGVAAYVTAFGIENALERMSVPTKLRRVETSLEEFSLQA